jgi:CDP-glucose 4,6-dehydratase
MMDPTFWQNRKVFLTGQTGFKGSWLCLWLHHLGAKVFAYSLPPPTTPSLYELAGIAELISPVTGDVRDLAGLEKAMSGAEPEIVIHLAAQSLVRRSYQDPVLTYSTNVLGTVHVLDAIRRVPSVRSVVVVTSDKCYHNEEWVWGYRENSELGGDDPYSSSKGCAELIVKAYRHSFLNGEHANSIPAIASARAGNVIGGGDWADDRLVPDVLRSLLKGEPTLIRKPEATRPWQHVLEPLHGYLLLAERLMTHGHQFASAWNFGPSDQSERTVRWIIDQLYRLWGTSQTWVMDEIPGPPETTFLKLDSSKARALLEWRAKLDLPLALEWIVNWTRLFQRGADMRAATIAEIEQFMAIKSVA